MFDKYVSSASLTTSIWTLSQLRYKILIKHCHRTQEFILLSDILGLSLLVDSIDHPKPPQTTSGTVLGPFHTHDAADISSGDSLSNDKEGVPLLCLCSIRDSKGSPVTNCKVDVWETDSHGLYDVQLPGRKEPDGRAVIHSDHEGKFWFQGIVPVEYAIPHDGPVGKLLEILGRHAYRPAHMHFMFEKEGFDKLITYELSWQRTITRNVY